MYQKILAPFDGSELSECTIEHIKTIAVGCQVREVILLTVMVPLPQVTQLGEEWQRDTDKKTHEAAENHLKNIAAILNKEGLSTQTIVTPGLAADEILEHAKKSQADLIIMSTHGRSGISRWVFGSVAEKVVRHSIVPVLAVSPHGCRVS
ncbi:universal stress protein [Chloroflexota bacterium]